VIRGVIFDLDGVLVSTDELHYESWKVLARQEDIHFDREINLRLLGVGRMECLEIVLERARRSYTAEERKALADQKNSYYRTLLENFTPADVLPGAGELLAALRERGIALAVGSSSRNAPLILARVGLDKAVDAVVDGNQISRSKPDPEVFLLAAERIGVEPGDCLVVEDAPAGVEAGRRAGMAVFAVGPRERYPDVELWAESLSSVSVDDILG